MMLIICIGFETAVDFAERGAKVILACRDPKKAQQAKEKIIERTNNTKVFVKELDLASLKSVRNFANKINRYEERLDILVNNAGALDLPPKKTEDGLLLLMQTNYFGPFLLTTLLLDLLKKTPKSRIINVSSIAAKYAKNFDPTTINEFPQNGRMKNMSVYAKSKLCNILFTIELAERLKSTSCTTYSVHPGGVLTSIVDNKLTHMKTVLRTVSKCFLKSCREGAQTTIYCSVAKGLETYSGQHFADCHIVQRYKTAQDPNMPKKLWTLSEKLVNLPDGAEIIYI